eukprot:6173184-Pleurochrysis_carterae.AAC.5
MESACAQGCLSPHLDDEHLTVGKQCALVAHKLDLAVGTFTVWRLHTHEQLRAVSEKAAKC